MIYQPVRFQDLHEPLFLKVESNHGVLPKLSYKSTPPTSNNILSEHWIGLLNSLESTQKMRTARHCDSGKKGCNTLWLNAMHSGKKW